ncbi:MAG: DUF3465 domain-containing protein [Betaproteobacteria bacterium]|nr:DUF3465 domain-containing protein [Betaproteobacteria bacterium]
MQVGRVLGALLFFVAVCLGGSLLPLEGVPIGQAFAQSDPIGRAFSERRSGFQVSGVGVVTRLLSDDDDGSRHQRFILRLSSGQTLLIAHNVDLAPRVDPLLPGDIVEFNGVYEWNSKGGVIHWTHHDPDRRHPGGWLRHRNRVFQ